MLDMNRLMQAIERGIKGGDDGKCPDKSVIIEATDMFYVYEFKRGYKIKEFKSINIDEVAGELGIFFGEIVTWKYGYEYKWMENLRGVMTIIFKEVFHDRWVQIFIDVGYWFDEVVVHKSLDDCIDHWSVFCGIEMWLESEPFYFSHEET